MKVYDQVCFPNKEGVIVSIDEEWAKLNYPCLKVKFEGETQEFSYTNGGCLCDNYYWMPTLSTSPYTLQGFEQKAPAPTYDEALDWFKSDEFKELHSPNKSSIDKIDEQVRALRELLVLRDYYNKGEVFDRVDFHGGGVYSIRLEDAGSPHFEIVKICNAEYPFTFWDKDTAEKFMSEQSFLLSIAKPLL